MKWKLSSQVKLIMRKKIKKKTVEIGKLSIIDKDFLTTIDHYGGGTLALEI